MSVYELISVYLCWYYYVFEHVFNLIVLGFLTVISSHVFRITAATNIFLLIPTLLFLNQPKTLVVPALMVANTGSLHENGLIIP